MKIEIMLDELIPDTQLKVMQILGINTPYEANYDILPLFTLDFDSDDNINMENFDARKVVDNKHE